MLTTYNLDKIKFSTDEQTYERAVGLYEGGKVTRLKGSGAFVYITKQNFNKKLLTPFSLDKLKKESRIVQIGITGNSVYYVPK